jgi:hypothetical protein
MILDCHTHTLAPAVNALGRYAVLDAAIAATSA